MSIIAVDIDGVLTVETEGFTIDLYTNRTPIPENIQKVNALYDSGHSIILYTARHLEDRVVTERWLKKHGVKYHSLVLGKLHYDILIDDKASSHFPDDFVMGL